MKVGVLGSGTVGQTLAAGFLKHGHEAMIGTREPAKLADWSKANPRGKVGSSSEAAAFGDVLVLAVKGDAAAKVLRDAGVGNLKG
ncbi:MAG TPA: NAD(P)-binding domain-containing protein, partial [Acidobacteriaceae bacterium]|nr:NAD(P)-binding domain-containing protein [Acidobacteriaceae bacterium]